MLIPAAGVEGPRGRRDPLIDSGAIEPRFTQLIRAFYDLAALIRRIKFNGR